MAKYRRWSTENKKAGRKKQRSKLGLTRKLHRMINNDDKKIRTFKYRLGL